jgi:hypothetical protein
MILDWEGCRACRLLQFWECMYSAREYSYPESWVEGNMKFGKRARVYTGISLP